MQVVDPLFGIWFACSFLVFLVFQYCERREVRDPRWQEQRRQRGEILTDLFIQTGGSVVLGMFLMLPVAGVALLLGWIS